MASLIFPKFDLIYRDLFLCAFSEYWVVISFLFIFQFIIIEVFMLVFVSIFDLIFVFIYFFILFL